MINWYKKSQTEGWPKPEGGYREIYKSKWQPVDSSFITDVAYFKPLGMFELKLKNGSKYSYANVPEGIFKEFMKSESKGQFFNNVIKPFYKIVKK